MKLKLTALILAFAMLLTACAEKVQYPQEQGEIKPETGLYTCFDDYPNSKWTHMTEDGIFFNKYFDYNGELKIHLMYYDIATDVTQAYCFIEGCDHSDDTCGAYLPSYAEIINVDPKTGYLYIYYETGELSPEEYDIQKLDVIKNGERTTLFTMSDGQRDGPLIFGDNGLYLPVRHYRPNNESTLEVIKIDPETGRIAPVISQGVVDDFYSDIFAAAGEYLYACKPDSMYERENRADRFTVWRININTGKKELIYSYTYPGFANTKIAMATDCIYTIEPDESGEKGTLVRINLPGGDTQTVTGDTWYEQYGFDISYSHGLVFQETMGLPEKVPMGVQVIDPATGEKTDITLQGNGHYYSYQGSNEKYVLVRCFDEYGRPYSALIEKEKFLTNVDEFRATLSTESSIVNKPL